MADLIKIAVDAMGGDNSPKKIIDGIIHNHKNNKGNFFKIFLFSAIHACAPYSVDIPHFDPRGGPRG